MDTHIEVNDSQVKAALAKLLNAVTNPRPWLAAIGAALTSSTQLRFRDSRAPDGSSWKPLSPVTIALRRGGSSKPLLDTGALAASQHYVVDDNAVEVGTNAVQARLQQLGAPKGYSGTTKRGSPIPWGDVPGRAFLGASDDDRGEILDILRMHLAPQ